MVCNCNSLCKRFAGGSQEHQLSDIKIKIEREEPNSDASIEGNCC